MQNRKIYTFYFIVFLTFFTLQGQDLENPYNPEPKMELLKSRKGEKPTEMHFLVFGDSKGSKHFPGVL